MARRLKKKVKRALWGILALGGSVVLAGVLYTCLHEEKDRSLKLNEPRNIRGVSNFQRTFNDLNDVQLEAARALGIPPVAGRAEAEDMKEQLEHIADNPLYRVDSLTHSIPYLVPSAKVLLDMIGGNFLDSLRSKGLNPNLLVVTSVLRTLDDVKDLRRRNTNASANSTHCYGTTFDISWKTFYKIEEEDERPLQSVGADTLKLVLAEVLRDLQQGRKCYVKYERNQGCFHITTRGVLQAE